MFRLALPVWLALTCPASACHRFSIWLYPVPQRCAVAPEKPAAPAAVPPTRDIPLPPLEWADPPDPPGWGQDQLDRLKGIGKLRELKGTN